MALVNGSVDHHLRGRRTEKVWRTVRWAENFPDDSLEMDTVDLTPPFAIRKIANLFERKKFSDCASIVGKLHGITLSSILAEVPIERLHETLPASLPIVEALYVKVQKSGLQKFPTGQLMTDSLVKRLVTVFAHQATRKEFEKASIVNSCRTILSIILSFESRLKDIIFQRKRAIDRCLRNMGKHGLVDSSGGKLMLLHDALKVEFEKVIIQYKCALQKLDELSLSTKYPMMTSVSSGPAPSEASHQRLMQVDRAEVQDRIIKNKTLHTVVEPAISNQYIKKLIVALQRRIEYDKILLFHDTELRKMSEGLSNPHIHLSQTLHQFSQGYGQLLALIADIRGEDMPPKDSQYDASSSDDDEKEGVSVTSTLSILERMKIFSLNGIIPIHRPPSRTGDTGSGRDSLNTINEHNYNTDLSPRNQHTHHQHTDAASSSSTSTTSVFISQNKSYSSGYRGRSIREASEACQSDDKETDGNKSRKNDQNFHGGRNTVNSQNNYHFPHHQPKPRHPHNRYHKKHYNPHHHPHHHHLPQPHHFYIHPHPHHIIDRPNGTTTTTTTTTTPYISYPIPMGMDHGGDPNTSLLHPSSFTPRSRSNSNSSINNNNNNNNSINNFNSNNSNTPRSNGMGSAVPIQTSPNVVALEKEITNLREELAQSREHIHRLQDQEKQLRERLSTFVHHQFTTKSTTTFEDLNLGSLRPTSLIRSYDDLYREGRIDTLDALDALPELKGLDILKMKILFSVVVLSFRCVQQSLQELKGGLRHLLCLPPPSRDLTSEPPSELSREVESHINNYLCKTIDTHDIAPMINEVCQNIYATLYDYPGLKQCAKLSDYAKTTVRLAWGLTVQIPPFYIVYDSKTFQDQTLSRFHTSDSESDDIKSFLWPILVDGQTGQCAAKGVVIT